MTATQHTMTTDEELERFKKIDAMRRMLDLLEANPVIPLPNFDPMDAFSYERDHLVAIVRAMKPVTKIVDRYFFMLRRSFGPDVALDVNFTRSDVCERVVIGTEEIPEKVIVAHTKDIVEWVCSDSIMELDDD